MNETNQTANQQFPLMLKTLGISFLIPGPIGIPGNIMIILAVFRKNSLVTKSLCTVLIGCLAMTDLTCTIHYVHSGLMMLMGWSWYPQIYCFLSQIPYIFAGSAGSFLIMNIAIDRWLSLQFPLKYMKFTRKTYLSFMIGVAVVFGIANLAFAAINASTQTIIPACNIPMSLHGMSFAFFAVSNTAINGIVIIVYTASYLRVRISGISIFKDAAHMKKEKHLLNSMLIVTVIFCCSWFAPIGSLAVMSALKLNLSAFTHASFFIGNLASLNFCSNFFIYFARGSEYRDEFLRLVGKKKNAVISIGGSGGTNNRQNRMKEKIQARANTRETPAGTSAL